MPFLLSDAADSTNPRATALAAHLDCSIHDLTTVSPSDDWETANRFDGPESKEYLVLTDIEADERAEAQALEILWAFSAKYLFPFLTANQIQAVQNLQEKLCEAAGPIIVLMLGDRLTEVLRDAIAKDGRGHFLASYDNEEHESRVGEVTFFIYRLN